MPRDGDGFLKREALVNGLAEQFSVQRGLVKHLVEIRFDERKYAGFAVIHRRTIHTGGGAIDSIETIEKWYGDALPAAQIDFKKKVRALGGRA